jgi:hypothetical protein
MTTAFWFPESKGTFGRSGVSQNRVIICKFHRNIYFDRGVVVSLSQCRMPRVLPGLELPLLIVRHSVLIICKIARIYFEVVQREVCCLRRLPVQVLRVDAFAATIVRIASSQLQKIFATDGVLPAKPWP